MKSKILFVCMVLIGALVACQQEDHDLDLESVQEKDINHLDFDHSDIETLFNQEFQVFDESGKYSITLNIGSDEEWVIDEYQRIANFKLNMIYFEDKFQDGNGSDISIEKPENLQGLSLSYHVTKLDLDPKANGFYLDVIFDQNLLANARVASYSLVATYDSPNTWMYWGRVDCGYTANLNPDIYVAWYYRSCRLCSMALDWGTILGIGQSSTYHKEGARRIRAGVHSNWSNYSVYFKKWEHDPWIQVK